MREEIKNILEDLYQLDPQLREQESELEKLVEQLLEAQPEVEVDEQFVRNLRNQLFADQESEEKINPLNMYKKLFFSFGGGVLATALVVAVVVGPRYFGADSEPEMIAMEESDGEQLAFAPSVEINDLGAEAFGDLMELSRSNGAVSEEAAGLGGGGTRSLSGVSESAVLESAEDSASSLIYPYNPVNYRFVYGGEQLELPSELNVYRSEQVRANAGSLVNMIKNYDFDLLDLDRYDGMQVESINLVQDAEQGYYISLNFVDSSISITQKWDTWQHPDQPLRMSDIPPDADLIAIADKFLDDNNIDLSGYGAPIVRNDWQMEIMYAEAEGRPVEEIYVPEIITLVYPIELDGMSAVDQGGYPMGLNISVSIVHDKVTNLYELRPLKFEQSQYPGVTDWSRIENYLAKGAGFYGYYDESAEELEVQLENAQIVMLAMWPESEISNGRYTRYFTPAISFDVVTPEDNPYFYPRKLTVPLAENLLAEMEDRNDQAVPEPRPLPVEPGPAIEPLILEESDQ